MARLDAYTCPTGARIKDLISDELFQAFATWHNSL